MTHIPIKNCFEDLRRVLALGNAVTYLCSYKLNTIEFTGPAIETITGYQAEDITAARWRDLTVLIEQNEEYADFTLEETQRRFRTGEIDTWKADIQIRTRSGGKRWISDTAVALRNELGECIGCTGIVMDITDQKESERSMAALANQLQRRNEEMENDLIMASEVQQAFVTEQPHRFPLEPASGKPALNFHHRYIPATTLAGDFYEILPLSDQTVGIFICDVVGHGVRAALLTTFLRGLLEELAPMGDPPGTLLSKMNRSFKAVFGQTENFLFATAFYMIFDLEDDCIHFANAGHPDPLRMNFQSGSVDPLSTGLDRPEPALGILEDFDFSTVEYKNPDKESIFLFTDGMIEAYDKHDNMFGEGRLAAFLEKNIEQPPEQLLDLTIREVYAFAGIQELEDDACLIAVVPAMMTEEQPDS